MIYPAKNYSIGFDLKSQGVFDVARTSGSRPRPFTGTSRRLIVRIAACAHVLKALQASTVYAYFEGRPFPGGIARNGPET